jgi:ABC-2 type transport system permease protein
LIRSLDLYNFWFARTVALRTAPTVLRAFAMVLFVMIAMPLVGLGDYALKPPPNLAAPGMFLVSMTAALMLSCVFTMVMHVVLVWTVSGEGLDRILPTFTMVLSGMTLPLPLFPDFLQPFLNAQPFRGLVDVPFRIYRGNIDAMSAIPDIGHQIVWTVFFIVLGRWLLLRSITSLVVQGG